MKYPILLIAVPLFLSLVVSESLLSDSAFSYLSQDGVNEGIRERRTANPPAAAQPGAEYINYRPYSQVPSNIKQLLQFQQAREPIHHIAAQPPPQLAKAPTPAKAQYNSQIQYATQSQAPSHPQYQAQPQANYQPQQSPQYQQNSRLIQHAYNPQQQQHFGGNHQQQQHFGGNHQQQQNFGGNHQQAPGNVFTPDQRRLY